MPNRIRTYKQEIFTDEKTGTLSGDAFRLFVGLISYADDYGVIEYRPQEFRVKVLPYAKDSPNDIVERLMAEIISRELVRPFQCGGRNYLFVVNFLKHQRVDKPGSPLLNNWKRTDTPEIFVARVDGTVTRGESSGTLASVREDSRELSNSREDSIWRGKEGNGEERRGTDGDESPRELYGVASFDSESFVQELKKRWPRVDHGLGVEGAAFEALQLEVADTGLSMAAAADNIIARITEVAELVAKWPRDQKRMIPGLVRLLQTRRFKQDDCYWEHVDTKGAKADERQSAIKRLVQEVS